MPPRYGKSELVSRRFPAWVLGRNPDESIIAASYSSDLASAMNRDTQRIIDDDAYRRLFPGTELSGKNVRSLASGNYLRNSDTFEVVGRRGMYRGAGRGQGITGLGCGIAIIDDPLKDREEADSPSVRQSLWEWYSSTLRTRLNPGGRVILCQTRWHPDDLAGRLLSLAAEGPAADQWVVLRLPAIAEDPLADGDLRRLGEPLWPTRFPAAELAKTQAHDSREWAALYQQRPRPEGGTEWPDSYFGPGIWFEDWPAHLVVRTMALDPSKGRDAKWGDYSAWVMLGRDPSGILWCEADMARRTVERIVDDGLELQRRFCAERVGIETNAFQELLATQIILAARAAGMPLPVVQLVNTVSKQVRIRRLGPYLAQGGIRFRQTPGTRLLVRQLQDFPLADHDDGPDALEMALRVMIELWNGRQEDAASRRRGGGQRR
jgi:predicted phage terminase large subunit-like protein